MYRASACVPVLILRDYSSSDQPVQTSSDQPVQTSSDQPVPTRKSKWAYPPPMKQLTIRERVATWDAANKLYFGPDRDMANFPSLVRPESIPPVRFGFIPDSWFQIFYEKTGVTGMQL